MNVNNYQLSTLKLIENTVRYTITSVTSIALLSVKAAKPFDYETL